VTIDTIGPAVTGPTITTAVNNTMPSFSYSATDTAGETLSYYCSVDSPNPPTVACGSATTKTYGTTGEGAHTFYLKVCDNSNNCTPKSLPFTIDTVGPTVTGPTLTTLNSDTNPNFSFSATDSAGETLTYFCSLDSPNPPTAACSSATSQSYSSVAVGNHTFYLKVCDNHSNCTSKSLLVPIGLCGKMSLLTDNFTTPGGAGAVWSYFDDNDMTFAQTGGQLVFTFASSWPPGSTREYAGYNSRVSYDLTNDRAYVHAVQVPGGGPTTQMYFELYPDDGNNYVKIGYEGGNMQCIVNLNGVDQSNLCNIGYSSTNHQWWQIRQAGSTLYFEASTDGNTFNPLASTPTPFDMSHVHSMLLVGAYTKPTAATTAIWDDLDGGVASSMKYCPASMPTDDFSGTTRGAMWGASVTDLNCTVTQSGGVLSVTPGANTPLNSDAEGMYETGSAFDLTGTNVSVMVPAVVNAFNCDEVLLQAVDFLTNSMVGIVYENGVIYCQRRIGYNNETQIGTERTYSPTGDLYWRLREQSGTTYCETSADGNTWNKIMPDTAQALPFSVTSVQLLIGANTCAPITTPGTAQFDNFNLP
jgi:hypothetical protein